MAKTPSFSKKTESLSTVETIQYLNSKMTVSLKFLFQNIPVNKKNPFQHALD